VVPRKHYLAVGILELVENMKQTALRLRLADDKLDIFDDKEVNADESVAKLVSRFLLDGLHEIRGELLATGISDTKPALRGLIAYGMSQVALADASAPVDEERIVFAPWLFSYRQGCGVGKTIRVAHNEGPEGVPGVELAQG
jgi:hypothetical protein